MCQNVPTVVCQAPTLCFAGADDPSCEHIVLVLEYVEGPPLVTIAKDGTCKAVLEPVARRLFADVLQVQLIMLRGLLSYGM